MITVSTNDKVLGTISLNGDALTGSTPGLQKIADDTVAQTGSVVTAYRQLAGSSNGYIHYAEGPATKAADAGPKVPSLRAGQAGWHGLSPVLKADPAPPPPEDSQEWPGWQYDQQLSQTYTAQLNQAFQSAQVQITSLYSQWQQGLLLVTSAILIQMMADAIASHLGPVLRGLWKEAWFVGNVSARRMVAISNLGRSLAPAFTGSRPHAAGHPEPEEQMPIGDDSDWLRARLADPDWGDWTPGDPEAAHIIDTVDDFNAFLASHGRSTIEQVSQTRMPELAAAIKDAVMNGDSPGSLAQKLSGILLVPSRAPMIARTEIARVVTAGTLSQYVTDGVSRKEWLVAPDERVCPVCNANKDEGGIPTTQLFLSGMLAPPAHPNCRCALAPAEFMGVNFDDLDSMQSDAIVTKVGPHGYVHGWIKVTGPATSDDIHTLSDLRDFAQMPKGQGRFTHAVRSDDELDSIAQNGIRPGPSGKVYLSQTPLVRDRGAGYVVVHREPNQVRAGTDVVETGLSYPEFTSEAVPKEDIGKIVRQVNTDDGFSIREDELAQYALDHQGLNDADVQSLPEKYRNWFNLPTAKIVTKVGKEGYIHGWICVRPPCDKPGDDIVHPDHGHGKITGTGYTEIPDKNERRGVRSATLMTASFDDGTTGLLNGEIEDPAPHGSKAPIAANPPDWMQQGYNRYAELDDEIEENRDKDRGYGLTAHGEELRTEQEHIISGDPWASGDYDPATNGGIEGKAWARGITAGTQQRAMLLGVNRQHRAHMAADNGLSPEQADQQMVSEMKNMLQGRRVATRITNTHLADVLDDNAFETQFETARSAGLKSNDARAALESTQFGYPETLDPKARPVYGYMDEGYDRPAGLGTKYIDDFNTDHLSTFGTTQVVFKDAVKDRTTFNVGDSMDNKYSSLPSWLSDPQPYSYAAFGKNDGGMVNPGVLKHMNRDYNGGEFRGNTFVEAQVHSPDGNSRALTPDDIDHVVFPGTPPAALRDQLAARNIPWSVQNPKTIAKTGTPEERVRAVAMYQQDLDRANDQIQWTTDYGNEFKQKTGKDWSGLDDLPQLQALASKLQDSIDTIQGSGGSAQKSAKDTNLAAFILIRARNQDGKWRYLLTKRADDEDDKASGLWSLPGGKLHEGEDPWAGALRESVEEIGELPSGLKPRITLVDDNVTTFVCELPVLFTPDMADAATAYESAGWGWFSKGDVEDLPLHPAFEKTWESINWKQLGKAYGITVDVTKFPHFNPLEHRNARGEWAREDTYEATGNPLKRSEQFSTPGPGLVLGDPKTADHVVTFVPGVGSDTYNGRQGDIKRMQSLKQQLDKHAGDGKTTALVLWQYKTPDSIHVATDKQYAEATTQQLKDYQDQLRAANPNAHMTVVGYSYGSQVAGEAAARRGMKPDELVFLASPGVSVHHAADTGVDTDHVWAGASKYDPIARSANILRPDLGGSPLHASFGARHYTADHPGMASMSTEASAYVAHSSYFRPDSDALPNIAAIATGNYDKVKKPLTSAPSLVGKKFNPLEARGAHGEWIKGDDLWKSGEGQLNDFSPQEAAAARHVWYRTEYQLTSDRLRNGTPPSLNMHTFSHPTESDDKYDRDISTLTGMIHRAPRFSKDAELTRGVSDAEGLFGPVGSKVGKIFSDKGFMSATTKPDLAEEYEETNYDGSVPGTIKIHVPPGGQALRSEPSFFAEGKSDWKQQHEFTFAPGTRFRVDSDEADEYSGVRTISVTQIDTGEPGQAPQRARVT